MIRKKEGKQRQTEGTEKEEARGSVHLELLIFLRSLVEQHLRLRSLSRKWQGKLHTMRLQIVLLEIEITCHGDGSKVL